MKIVPDLRYPRGTRDIFVASLSNHSVYSGSVVPCVETSRLKAKGRYVSYWGGRGVDRGILEFFCEKSRGPPTSWNGLMHDSSEIPKQKHLTLPLPIQDKNNRK